MKHYKSLWVAALSAMALVVGCSLNDDGEDSKAAVVSVRTAIPANLSEDVSAYPVSIELPETAFADATVFNKDLAIVSLANAMQTSKKDSITAFYEGIGFDNITTNADYDLTGAHTISYCLAHRKMWDYDFVAVTVRGANYGAEWISNFTIGSSGDHEGFLAAANTVYAALTSYLAGSYNDAYTDGKVKLWISGYSRGAAVANVLSWLILGDADKKLAINQNKVFTYTFNTPRGLTQDHATDFPNVFNVINEADIVSRIAPVEYGLYRCGIDKVLFAADDEVVYDKETKTTTMPSGAFREKRWFASPVDKALAALDSSIELPGFRLSTATYREGQTPSHYDSGDYTTEKGMIDYLLAELMKKDGTSTGGYSLQTRELFATTVQSYLAYTFALFLEHEDILESLVTTIETEGLMKVYNWLMVQDAFYTDLAALLDEKSIGYEAAQLQTVCNAVFEMVDFTTYNGCLTDALIKILPLAMGDNKDLKRMISQHYCEVTYALLKASDW